MRKQNSESFDYSLVAVIWLLVGFGLVMLYSTSAYMARVNYMNDMFLFRKQALISVAAIALALILSFADYHILRTLSPLAYAAAVILMLLVKSSLGVTHNGARRWLKIGIEFQPSEVAKIAVIVFIPMLIVRAGRRFQGILAVLPPLAAGAALSVITYVFTDNLSTAVIVLIMTCVIIFVAHPRTIPFFLVAAAGAAVVVLIVLYTWRTYADVIDLTELPFRIRRVLVWRNPEKYADEGGYQILQGLYAIGSGGFFGKGLGNSTQKLGPVPEAENDMIFSIICEELGIFGCAIVIILFGYLLYRLFYIAQNAPDLYGSLMVTGIFTHIAVQVILNICVVINLIPTTGVTLPFISYGGTSVLFLMLEMAIALSVSRRIRYRREERDLWGEVVASDL